MSIQRTTLATMRTRLQEKYESVPFWTSEEARLALNESLRWWNLFTATWSVRLVFGMPRAQHWLVLPATIVYDLRVEANNRPLDYASLEGLDNGRPGWESEHTESGGDVPTVPSLWAPAGLTRIAVWPADARGCNTLTIDGVRRTPILVNDADYIDLSEEEHSLLLGEALHIAAFKEGGARWEATTTFHEDFIRAAMEKNRHLARDGFYRKYLGLDRDRPAREAAVA